MGFKMEITPSIVKAPVGSQVLFTCKYWSSAASDLNITVESSNVYDVEQTRFDGGAQLTFHHVVSSDQHNVKCIVSNNKNLEIGLINVMVSPGLNTTHYHQSI